MGSFLFLTFFTQPGFSVCLCLRSTLYGCCAHVFKQKEGKTKHQKAVYSCFFIVIGAIVAVVVWWCWYYCVVKQTGDTYYEKKKNNKNLRVLYICMFVKRMHTFKIRGSGHVIHTKWQTLDLFFFLFLAMAGCLGLMLEFVVVVWMYEVVKFTFWVHFLLYRFFFCSILTPADSF